METSWTQERGTATDDPRATAMIVAGMARSFQWRNARALYRLMRRQSTVGALAVFGAGIAVGFGAVRLLTSGGAGAERGSRSGRPSSGLRHLFDELYRKGGEALRRAEQDLAEREGGLAPRSRDS